MPKRTRCRTVCAVGAAVVAAALGPLALAARATPAPAQAVTIRETRAEAQVNFFYKDYRRAIERRDPVTAKEVRTKYLTQDLNRRLDAWAKLHEADPVFRAQNAPPAWSVRYEGSGAGHATVILTERWGHGPQAKSQDVWYAVRLDTLVISDIEDPPR
ncbi:hypothetical protein ACFP1Z_16230 [Streptomyces gamaensis]|uniref:Secreted protein n=1 Tax=Streptomyces gamaensis TaxID=1763542 RepID=A0ABW0YZ32_9ACTN